MAENIFSPLEYKLYGRQMLLAELGSSGQHKLKNSHLLVVGAGGLGAPALLYLAGAGIGHITVVDDDSIELSNLHRQVIHTYAAVGNSKAESAAAAMRSLNPTVTVTCVRDRLTEVNADRLVEGVTAVIDGSDNFATRYLVSAACARAGIAHIWGAILGFDAQMSVFWAGRGPVYEDLYPQQPVEGSVPTCATAGVIGAMAGVVGTSMAMEAIKIAAGMGRPLIGELGYYSALEGRWEYIPLRAADADISGKAAPVKNDGREETVSESAPVNELGSQDTLNVQDEKPQNLSAVEAETPGEIIECSFADFQRAQRGKTVQLVDIREPAEFIALSIPGSVNLPLSTLVEGKTPEHIKGLIDTIGWRENMAIAVYCSGGQRAEQAARILRDMRRGVVYHITDGISGWLGETFE